MKFFFIDNINKESWNQNILKNLAFENLDYKRMGT